MAVASLVLGILALIPFIPFPIGPIVAIVGLILGVISRKKLAEAGAPTGMATAGMVMCIIGLALSILFWVLCAACIAGLGGLEALL